MFDDYDPRVCNSFIEYVYNLASEEIEDEDDLQKLADELGRELYLEFDNIENIGDEIVLELIEEFKNKCE